MSVSSATVGTPAPVATQLPAPPPVLTLDEVVGRYSSILFGARTNIRGIEANREKLSTGESTVTDMLKYRKDGSTYWTEASVHPLPDTSGRYTFWVSIERNITARRELEDHMRLLQLALDLGRR